MGAYVVLSEYNNIGGLFLLKKTLILPLSTGHVNLSSCNFVFFHHSVSSQCLNKRQAVGSWHSVSVNRLYCFPSRSTCPNHVLSNTCQLVSNRSEQCPVGISKIRLFVDRTSLDLVLSLKLRFTCPFMSTCRFDIFLITVRNCFGLFPITCAVISLLLQSLPAILYFCPALSMSTCSGNLSHICHLVESL